MTRRLLAVLLLGPTGLACDPADPGALGEAPEDDTGASEETTTGDPLEDDLAPPPSTTQARDLHRSRVAVGGFHACAVLNNGTVRCWGDNEFGALGNGTTTDSTTPVTVSGLQNVVAIDAGYWMSVALRSNGTVYRWGKRVLSNVIDTTPQLVPGLSNIVSIGVDDHRACAVRSDGHTFCWGHGYLGDGNGTTDTTTPVEVAGIATAIATNGTCVLLANGTIECWGMNDIGQVGDGTTSSSDAPVPVEGITTAVAIESSYVNTYAVLSDGTVRGWGLANSGSLGSGAPPDLSATPVEVLGIENAVAIATGDAAADPWEAFACAALVDGSARCWGRTSEGGLGNGEVDADAHPTPEVVIELDGVVDLDASARSVCASRVDGSVRCWGSNDAGQLGDGTTTDRDTPVAVVGLSSTNDGSRVTAGNAHTCGLRSNGTVKCWGENGYGQVGDGTTTNRTSATLVGGLSGAIEIAAGGYHTCARIDDGGVRCWGRNELGQLGDDGASGLYSTTPVAVEDLDDVAQLAASEENTCAIRANGTVACWGSNLLGQLGNGNNTASDVPVAVAGLTGAIAIDATRFHVCALRSNGYVSCWGDNAKGQLGNGAAGAHATSNIPVTVRAVSGSPRPLANVVAIAAGSEHTCAVMTSGAAKCWGAGDSGALGNGALSNSSYPVNVSALTNGIDVAAGNSLGCALRAHGGVACWGDNTYGELGNGDDDSSSTPVAVGVLPLWLTDGVDIDAGLDHACVAKGDGTIACWGRNDDGQLGDTTTIHRNVPVVVSAFP